MKEEPIKLTDLSDESLRGFVRYLCIHLIEEYKKNLIKQDTILDNKEWDSFDKSLALLIKSSQCDAIINMELFLHKNILFLDKNQIAELQEQKKQNQAEMELHAKEIITYVEPKRKKYEKKINE